MSARWIRCMSHIPQENAIHSSSSTPMALTVWFENILPLRSFAFDPRSLWAKTYARQLLSSKETTLHLLPESVKSEIVQVHCEPNLKEGGLFLHLKLASVTQTSSLLSAINSHLKNQEIKSPFSLYHRDVYAYFVRGKPWVEDLWARVPSRRLRVEFHGPDVSIESLYREFRLYGRILDIKYPSSFVKDMPRFAYVDFVKIRDAATARMCTHGDGIDGTRISIGYEEFHQDWWIWTWITSHPRITLPILFGLLAGISYVIFDPLRVLCIKNQIVNGFTFKKWISRVQSWYSYGIRKVMSTFSTGADSSKKHGANLVTWPERMEHLKKLSFTLASAPENIILICGPSGSGKSELIFNATANRPFKVHIDCGSIVSETGHRSLASLAEQINYFPSFASLSSLSNLVDSLISVGTGAKIGQGKDSIPGLSSSTEADMRKMLDCLTFALSDIVHRQEQKVIRESDEGTMISAHDIEYPVVVISNYLNATGARAQLYYTVFADWAAACMEQKIAHIVFMTDQPSANKSLMKAHATRPIDLYTLTDASPASAVSYVREVLMEMNISEKELKKCVEEVGGRLTDLELLVQKLKTGRPPRECLEDLVNRAIAEVSKLGFAREADEGMGWTAMQFWKIVQLLAKKEEIVFDDLRYHALFKGDPRSILALERAGLVSVIRDQKREQCIRAGKPLFRAAFREMAQDKKLVATMGIDTTKYYVAEEEKKLKTLEEELLQLSTCLENIRQPSFISSIWNSGKDAYFSVSDRIRFLGEEIQISSRKIEGWKNELQKLKKIVNLTE